MACKFQSNVNANDSILGQTLLDIANGNEIEANAMLNHFRTPYFINKVFGDYKQAYDDKYVDDTLGLQDRTDENGEPMLFYNATDKTHYYIDKDQNKINYPPQKQGLKSFLTSTNIAELASTLGLKFYQKTKDVDFEADEDIKINLPAFIKEFIQSKIDEINENENSTDRDFERAFDMARVLDHVNELSKNIANRFKTINFELEEDFTNEDTEARDYNFSKSSAETNRALGVRQSIKLMLSLLEDKNKKDFLFNENQFLPFETVYGTLGHLLADEIAVTKYNEEGVAEVEDIYAIFREKVSQLATAKEEYKEVLDALDKLPEYDRNAFVKTFYMGTVDAVVTDAREVKGKGRSFTSKSLKRTGSVGKIIQDDWFEQFKDNFISNGKITVKSQGVLENINSVVNDIVHSKQSLEVKTEYVRENLNKLGIVISRNGFNDYLKAGDFYASNEDIESRLLDVVTNINYLLESDGTKIDFSKLFAKVKTEEFNFNTAAFYRNLADSEGKFREDRADSTTRVGGKTMWNFSNMSAIRAKILTFKKYPEVLKRHVVDSKAFYKTSMLANHLLDGYNKLELTKNAKDRLNNLGLNTFLGIQTEGEVKETGSLALNDYLVDNYNKLLAGQGVKTIAPADKGTDYQVKVDFKINTNGAKFGEGFRFSDKAVNVFRVYFHSEVMRMEEAWAELDSALAAGNLNKLTVHYHVKKGKFGALLAQYKKDGTINKSLLGNAFKSQMFPDLNPGTAKAREFNLYNEDGRPQFLRNIETGQVYDNWNNPGFMQHGHPELQAYIKGELQKLVNDQYKSLLKTKVLEFNDKGELENKLLAKERYNEYYDKIKDNLGDENKVALSKAVGMNIASDILVNGLIQNIEYAKLFTGDPAFYKDMVDFKKRVPATYTDGIQLRLKPGQEFFNIAIIDSVEIASPYLDRIIDLYETPQDKAAAEKTYGKGKINAADAQAWITPQRWRFLLEGVGNWSDAHDKLYKKMMSKEPQEYTLKELKIAASPVKGVYFELNDGVPTYLKYSQAVLSPNLIQGNKGLETIYKKMIDNKVDELITLDGIKVGAKNPSRIHNEDGTIMDDFMLNPMTIMNSGWKMQQDLPVKTFKETEVGSQIQKNIFAGLIPYIGNDKVKFDFNGKELTAQEMINEIVNTTRGLSDIGLDKLLRKFKINQDGTIKNVAGFYKSLVEELTKRGGNENVISALTKEVSLYGIPQSQSKIINTFASIFLNNVVKIKTNGGSFIQMSNTGISKAEGDTKGVIWSPKVKPGDTTYEPYKTVEDGKIKIKPAGILISGSFIAKYIPDYKSKTAEQLFGYTDETTGEFVQGLIDPQILESLIGYRIPNQGLSSNDAMEIIGILPEENGDTIVAYTGITAKTGSDFDIDKQYVMMPTYHFNEGRLEYVDHNESDEESLQNRLIQLYKSTLLNPEVIKTVMKPIDVDFMKTEINSIIKENTGGSLYHFNPDNDIKLRFDFLKGKMGVGQVANVMVDINRPGQLVIKGYSLKGATMKDGDMILDQHSSNMIADTKAQSEATLRWYAEQLGIEDEKEIQSLVDELMNVPLQDSVMAVLNGFVDIAKDPFITKGNWITATTNAGSLLLRSGMHPLTVTNFLAQPILREYFELQASKEGVFGEDKSSTKKLFIDLKFAEFTKDITINHNGVDIPLSEIFKQVVWGDVTNFDSAQEYIESENTPAKIAKLFSIKGELTGETKEGIDNIITELKHNVRRFFSDSGLTLDNITFQQLRGQHTNPDFGFQMQVLDKFFEVQQVAKNLKQVTDLMKVDTSGFGKNINGIFKLQNLYKDLVLAEDSGITGTITGVKARMTNSITGVYYHNVVERLVKIAQNNPLMFPQATKATQQAFNIVSQSIYGKSLQNDELADKLEQSFFSYTLSEFFKENTRLNDKTYIDALVKSVPNVLLKFQKENKGKYLIVDQLKVIKDGQVNKLVLNNREKSSTFQDDLVNSWRDLMDDNAQLANALIEYSFITSNFKYKSGQFFTLIPHEYFVKKDINSFIKKFTNPANNLNAVQHQAFVDKFLLNNVSNSYLVPKVFDSELGFEKSQKMSKDSIIFLQNGAKAKPFIKTSMSKVYKYKGEFIHEGMTNYVYTRVNPLQYSFGSETLEDYLDRETLNHPDNDLSLLAKLEDKMTTRDIYKIGDTANEAIIETPVTLQETIGRPEVEQPIVEQVETIEQPKEEVTEAVEGVTSDEYKYYGKYYQLTLENGVAISVDNYKGKKVDEQKILDNYNENPDVDPQNGKNFRNVEKLSPTVEAIPVTPSTSSFKPANQEQVNAIEDLRNFIDKGNPSQFYTLIGKAGTGKTTIIQEVLAPYVASGKKIGVAALSHQAKNVLGSKIDARFPNNSISKSSIASLLGIKLDENTGKFERDTNLKPKILNMDIIIIDESSMINEQMYDLIMELKRANAKLIFLGDSGQLPPIRDRKNPYYKKFSDAQLNDISPTFNTPNQSSLKERVRQGEESPILPFADIYWNKSHAITPAEIKALPKATKEDFEDKLTPKGNLVFARNMYDVIGESIPMFKQAVETGNPNFIKIVTYRNDTRNEYNESIREGVFGQGVDEYVENDLIRLSGPYAVDIGLDQPVVMENSEEYQIESSEPVERGGYKAYNITFKGMENLHPELEMFNYFTAVHPKDAKKWKADVSNAWNHARSLPMRSVERFQAMDKARRLGEMFIPIDYNYAITSHKSQGSTYNTVIVDLSDIYSVPISEQNKARSGYTAITRASQTAVVVHNKLSSNQEHLHQVLSMEETSTIEEETVEVESKWNDYKDALTALDPTMTKEIFDSLSEKEQENLIKCIPF